MLHWKTDKLFTCKMFGFNWLATHVKGLALCDCGVGDGVTAVNVSLQDIRATVWLPHDKDKHVTYINGWSFMVSRKGSQISITNI